MSNFIFCCVQTGLSFELHLLQDRKPAKDKPSRVLAMIITPPMKMTVMIEKVLKLKTAFRENIAFLCTV